MNSDYLQKMRHFIGHETLILCGASIILANAKGELLLQKRTDNGQWDYAGGAVDPDERVEDAARRELREETGLLAGELTLLGVYSGREQHLVYPNGDHVSNIDIVYVCSQYSGTLRVQAGETEKLRFFSAEALPNEIQHTSLPAINDYICRYANPRRGVNFYE